MLIEQSSSALPVDCDALTPGVAWRRSDWDFFHPELLAAGQQRLVVANAVPRRDAAIRFFHWLRDNPAPSPTLAIIPAEDAELLHAGSETADDFLIWPVRREEFGRRVARLLGPPRSGVGEVTASLVSELGLRQLVGNDPAFLGVLQKTTAFAASAAPVLITGETGTGKELCAHAVHLLSKRREGPFIPVECGALPEHLFENELFGHMRGAFTDAHADQRGLVALAQGGTLFLDEVDSLSLTLQAKLLRLVQEQTYRPLGSEQFRSSSIRVIAATNTILEQLVRGKQFREDLFFRLNVLRLHLPPLRERRGDIALLAHHFAEQVCAAAGVQKKVLSPASIRRLEGYDWPGNIRELYNVIQRTVYCVPGIHISAADIELSPLQPGPSASPKSFRNAKSQVIAYFEQDYVRGLLEKHGGNITRAAQEAGKDRRAFGRLVKRYGLQRPAA